MLKNNISANYNAISIDRFPSKTKIGKNSWYFNNSLLRKPDFYKKDFLSPLKAKSPITPQQVIIMEPEGKKML